MKNLLLILSVSVVLFSCKQEVREDPNAVELAKHLSVYEVAKKNNDFYTASVALNYALRIDSSNNALIDTLSRLYFNLGNVDAAVVQAEKIIGETTNDKLKELVGLGYQRQGKRDEAISIFLQLHESVDDDKYLYQVAVLNLEKGDVENCDSMLNFLLENGDSSSVVENSVEGKVEEVPLAAACHNLKGIIAVEMKRDIYGAAREFRKALKIAPDYSIPKAYLQQISEYQRMMAGQQR